MKLTERANDFIKGAVNTVLDASVERQQLINALNSIFKEMYITELVERLVKVSTCKGMEQFKHEMSASTFRSGLLFEVQNDASLRKVELQDLAFVILGFPPMIRQLKLLGFDTLVINGKNIEGVFYRIAEGIGILDNETPHKYLKHTQVVPRTVINTPIDATPQEQNPDGYQVWWALLILLVITIIVVIIADKNTTNNNTATNSDIKVDTIAATPNITVSRPGFAQHLPMAQCKTDSITIFPDVSAVKIDTTVDLPDRAASYQHIIARSKDDSYTFYSLKNLENNSPVMVIVIDKVVFDKTNSNNKISLYKAQGHFKNQGQYKNLINHRVKLNFFYHQKSLVEVSMIEIIDGKEHGGFLCYNVNTNRN